MMSSRVTVFVGLLAACALQAFAEEPKTEEPPTTTSAPAGTMARNEAASAQSTADVVEEGESQPITQEQIDLFLKNRGYTPVEIKGVMHYCRKEAPFGTRVKKSVCITGEQAKELRTAAKEEMRRIDQRMWKDET